LLAPEMQAEPDRYVDADVSTADMKREYERLVAEDPVFAAAVAADSTPAPAPQAGEQPGGGMTSFFTLMQNATNGQRTLVGVACRGWLSYLLGHKAAPSAMDAVILDYRNRQLADQIVNGPDNIFITYGAGHLPGLLADLQAIDPARTIASVKWMRAIDTPEDLEGEI
jgi:hypothetical protein